MPVIIGVDTGGTFTDVVLLDLAANTIRRAKVSTNVENPEVSIVAGVQRILQEAGQTPDNICYIVHATTIGSNTLLGQVKLEIPRVAVLTTRGFRDVIYIGRQCRPSLYDIYFRKARPPVDPDYIIEVDERVLADGRVLKEIREDELKLVTDKLRQLDPEVVAVCYLNSYANPVNEIKTAEYLRRNLGKPVVLSSEVSPTWREYERFSTTILNAVLLPVMSSYIERLRLRLREALGRDTSLYIVASYGGFADPDTVIRKPILTIESGPAAGVVACRLLAVSTGMRRAIAFDMGGTTAKFSPIVDYEYFLTEEYEVGGRVHMGRRVRGTGLPLCQPMIDVVEISAGGGTVIHVDDSGMLRVGPISVGADPGPACYARGGDKPTITDAHVVLHRLNPRYLLGGEFRIREDLAREAFKKHVLEKTSLDLEEAAYGAIKIANTQMARGIKIATIERGLDPREFTLVAYGGAGPLHACELAEELDIRRVVIPPCPGVFTALGLVAMDLMLERRLPVYRTVDEVDLAQLSQTVTTEVEKMLEHVKRAGLRREDAQISVKIGMRYTHQDVELYLDFDEGATPSKLRQKFEQRYSALYGYTLRNSTIEITQVRIIVTVPSRVRVFSRQADKLELRKPPESCVKEVREVFTGETWRYVKIYDRALLRPGHVVEGPAVIEDYDSTVFIPESWTCIVDEYRCLLIERL